MRFGFKYCLCNLTESSVVLHTNWITYSQILLLDFFKKKLFPIIKQDTWLFCKISASFSSPLLSLTCEGIGYLKRTFWWESSIMYEWWNSTTSEMRNHCKSGIIMQALSVFGELNKGIIKYRKRYQTCTREILVSCRILARNILKSRSHTEVLVNFFLMPNSNMHTWSSEHPRNQPPD